MKTAKSLIIFGLSLIVILIPIIDLFGGSGTVSGNIWVNKSYLSYFFDLTLFITGFYSGYKSLHDIS